MTRKLALVPVAFILALVARVALADAPMPMLTPGDIKWGDAPPVFPVVSAIGPFAMTYVNPEDDPTKKTAAK